MKNFHPESQWRKFFNDEERRFTIWYGTSHIYSTSAIPYYFVESEIWNSFLCSKQIWTPPSFPELFDLLLEVLTNICNTVNASSIYFMKTFLAAYILEIQKVLTQPLWPLGHVTYQLQKKIYDVKTQSIIIINSLCHPWASCCSTAGMVVPSLLILAWHHTGD